MQLRLAGKVAIITGAAGGIGSATVQRFIADGAQVVAVDIDEPGLAALAKRVGGTVVPERVDVCDPAAMQSLVDRTVERFGRLDVIFNNAGGALPKPTHESSLEDWRRILSLNLDAVYYGVHAALPVMMRQKAGVILATSSGAGLGGVTGLAAYGAAKAGVVTLMKNLAVDYGAMGIRANAIAPGPMDTPGLRRYLDTIPDGARRFAAQVPSGRLGTGDDIAACAAFLASDDATYINGVVVPVDGGIFGKLASPQAG